MKLIYNVFIFLFLIPVYLFADFKGQVFLDSNGNGLFDKGDKALSGIMVSDGLNVTITKADGSFVLQGNAKARFISITRPSGYKINKSYIPIQEQYDVSYNFAMQACDISKNKSFSFIHITDTESSVGGKWVSNLRDYARNEKSAFIMHTGDICYDEGLKFHSDSINTSTMGTSVHYGIGNHDLLKGRYGEESFEKLFGPAWYSFDVGDVHFVVTPMPSGDHAPSYNMDHVIDWLKNDLANIPKGKAIVLFNHDLLLNDSDLILRSKGNQIDLSEYNVKAWVYGHWHINHIKKHHNGLLSVCSSPPDKGGIDHSPSTFRVFRFNKQGVMSIENRYTYIDKLITCVYPNDREMASSKNEYLPISANAYNTTSAIVKMDYTLDQTSTKKWHKMSQNSEWNWTAKHKMSPTNTEYPQSMELKVRAQTASGKIIETKTAFNYSNQQIVVNNTSGEWLNLRGNAAHDSLPNNKATTNLQHAWITNIGAPIFMTSPIIADNKVFIASIDDAQLDKCGVYAIDALSGNLLWQYKTLNSIKNTIVYAKGKVFATDTQGRVYAIDAQNGSLVWIYQLAVAKLPAIIEGMVTDGELIFAGSGHGLCALKADDGTVLWTNTEWKQQEGTSSTMTLGDGVLLTGAHWGALYAHDAYTGKLLWKRSDLGLRFRDGSATYRDGRFYIASAKHLFVIASHSGDIEHMRLSEYEFNSASSPLLFENKWITGTSKNGILAFDQKSLSPIWKHHTLPALFYTVPYSKNNEQSVEVSPVINGSYVYSGASDGWLYVLDVDSGNVLWKTNLGAPIFSSVALCGRLLIVADFSGNVHAFMM
ncbi:phosphoesterase [Bacteroidales bacterium]|nr:phosphoesterase [Bacteroidales bacterium]